VGQDASRSLADHNIRLPWRKVERACPVTGTIDMASSVFSHGSAAGYEGHISFAKSTPWDEPRPSPSLEAGPHQHSGMA
jgi:hypothetical protein